MDDGMAAILCIPFLLPAFIVLLLIIGGRLRGLARKVAATGGSHLPKTGCLT